jgi:hypothetical protein
MNRIAALEAAGYVLYLSLIWYAGNKFCRVVFVSASRRCATRGVD